jgi:hypothetical protein
MKIKQPAFEPALIPEGAYLGNPPVPSQDVLTVAVYRTLLARDDANAAAIRTIAAVLMEQRQEIMEAVPCTREPSAFTIRQAVLPARACRLCRPDTDSGPDGRILDLGTQALDAKPAEECGGSIQQPGSDADGVGARSEFAALLGGYLARSLSNSCGGRARSRCRQAVGGLFQLFFDPFCRLHWM